MNCLELFPGNFLLVCKSLINAVDQALANSLPFRSK